MLIAHKKHIICVTKQRRLCQVKQQQMVLAHWTMRPLCCWSFLKSMMYFPARTVLGRINFWQKDTLLEAHSVNGCWFNSVRKDRTKEKQLFSSSLYAWLDQSLARVRSRQR